MKIINDLQTDSIRIKPRRLFYCPRENLMMERKKVYKVKDDYFCNACHTQVEDRTNTETGQEILRWI